MDKAADMAGNYFSRIDIVSYYKGRKKYPTCNTAYLATTNGTFMKCIYRKKYRQMDGLFVQRGKISAAKRCK